MLSTQLAPLSPSNTLWDTVNGVLTCLVHPSQWAVDSSSSFLSSSTLDAIILSHRRVRHKKKVLLREHLAAAGWVTHTCHCRMESSFLLRCLMAKHTLLCSNSQLRVFTSVHFVSRAPRLSFFLTEIHCDTPDGRFLGDALKCLCNYKELQDTGDSWIKQLKAHSHCSSASENGLTLPSLLVWFKSLCKTCIFIFIFFQLNSAVLRLFCSSYSYKCLI